MPRERKLSTFNASLQFGSRHELNKQTNEMSREYKLCIRVRVEDAATN
jgi:hypothetical protein